MPATPARAAFVREPFRRAVAITPGAATRHGKLARESDDPVETFFDDVDDAQTLATARQSLLSPERYRFRVAVAGIDEVRALSYIGQTVLARYADGERGIDMTAIVSEIVIDPGQNRAILTVWG